MAVQTYRDPATGKIYDAQGNHIQSLPEYQAGIRTGKYAPAVDKPVGTTVPANPYYYNSPVSGGMNPYSTTPAMMSSTTPVTANTTAGYTAGNATGFIGPVMNKPAVVPVVNKPAGYTAGNATGFIGPVMNKPAVAPVVNKPVVPTGGSSGSSYSGGSSSSTAPVRNADGTVSVPTNPIDAWKNQTAFIEAAKEVIRNKQGFNKDIQNNQDYWRSIIRDTSPFGGVRDTAMDATGATFTDKDMQLLSPEDQASIRASRYAAGQGHLQGLAEEQKYRETQTSDILAVMKDYYTEKAKEIEAAKQDASDAEKAKLDREKFEWEKKSKAIDQQIASSKASGSTSNKLPSLQEATAAYSQAIRNGIDPETGGPILGKDGKMSPKNYNDAKSQWSAETGRSSIEFDKAMAQFRNPKQNGYEVDAEYKGY